MSFSMLFSPSTILSRSPSLINPTLASIVACAIDPAISCLYIRRSYEIDSTNDWASLSVASLILACQDFCSAIAANCRPAAGLRKIAVPPRSCPSYVAIMHPPSADHLGQQIVWLLILAIPVACVAWTVTKEEVFKEPRMFFEE